MSSNREQFRPPDHENDHFLLTTTVGSYRKPTWLSRARDLEEGERDFDEADLAAAEDDAARLLVREHERIGLDVVTDGEARRREMIEYVMRRIDGTEFHGPVKVWGHNYFEKATVVEEVAGADPWLREEFAFARSVASRPVKVPITGPYTLARFSFSGVYEDTEALAYDLADLVNTKVESLVEAGARYVQVDEPGLAQVPGDHAIVGECLERIVAGVPEEVRVGLHVCYGDYSRIYPEILDYPVDEIDLELANEGYDQLDVLTEPAFTKDLALGVVDVHDAEVESVEEIESNIRRGLEIVPPGRLTVSPDCGPKLLSREVAREKLSNMVRAARNVEAKLDAGEIEVPR